MNKSILYGLVMLTGLAGVSCFGMSSEADVLAAIATGMPSTVQREIQKPGAPINERVILAVIASGNVAMVKIIMDKLKEKIVSAAIDTKAPSMVQAVTDVPVNVETKRYAESKGNAAIIDYLKNK